SNQRNIGIPGEGRAGAACNCDSTRPAAPLAGAAPTGVDHGCGGPGHRLKPQPRSRSRPRMNTGSRKVPARELGVGEVAARSGVAVSALHFYEKKGLIHSLRTAGNQRRYRREVLRRIAVIKVAQRAGIPLAQIRDALDALPDGRTPTVADWKRLSRRWRDDLDARIARLTGLRDSLDGCIGCGCLSLKACPLRNPGDVLGEDGPGPRLLDPKGGP